jgi:hypothetical protein
MENLGMKIDEMYPSAKQDETHYPSVRVPLSILGDKGSVVGAEHKLVFKGKLSGMDKTHATFDLTHGEASESPKEEEGETKKEEEKETVLGRK